VTTFQTTKAKRMNRLGGITDYGHAEVIQNFLCLYFNKEL